MGGHKPENKSMQKQLENYQEISIIRKKMIPTLKETKDAKLSHD